MPTQILNQEIYNNALALIAQDINGKDIDDLEERAPYLIASFCCSAKSFFGKSNRVRCRKVKLCILRPSFSSARQFVEPHCAV